MSCRPSTPPCAVCGEPAEVAYVYYEQGAAGRAEVDRDPLCRPHAGTD